MLFIFCNPCYKYNKYDKIRLFHNKFKDYMIYNYFCNLYFL